MRLYIFLLIGMIILTNCATSSHWVEKEIEQCILDKSKDTYDRDVEVDQIELAIGFEQIMLDENFLSGKSSSDYGILFESLQNGKIDSIELSLLLEKAHNQNLDLLGYPSFQVTPYACVKDIQQKYPQVFESSQSLKGLSNSLNEFQRTMDLATIVTSITNTIPNSEFEEKIIYRIPVITTMYSIFEQSYDQLSGSVIE